MPDGEARIYAIDFGVVLKREGDAWVQDPDAQVDDGWLDELWREGFTPQKNASKGLPQDGSGVRVVPLGLHPHIAWSGDGGQKNDTKHEELYPPPPVDPFQMGPGSAPGGAPPWVGKVIVWGGTNLIWDGLKWIVKHPVE
jgi:hypothetical protein